MADDFRDFSAAGSLAVAATLAAAKPFRSARLSLAIVRLIAYPNKVALA